MPKILKITPKTITLTRDEWTTLSTLNSLEQSALGFWYSALRARGITIPSDKVIRISPINPHRPHDSYRLEFEPKALGRKAILAGQEYRQFAQKKDEEWEKKSTLRSHRRFLNA